MAFNPLSGSTSQMHADFKNFQTQLNALQSALNTGNQAQLNSTKASFSTTLNQMISDLSAVQGQSANGLNQSQNVASSKTTNLQNDLQTLQNALNSVGAAKGSSSQTSLSNAVSKVQTDVSSMRKGHHQNNNQKYSGPHAVRAGNANNNDTLSALAELFGNSGQNQNTGGTISLQA